MSPSKDRIASALGRLQRNVAALPDIEVIDRSRVELPLYSIDNVERLAVALGIDIQSTLRTKIKIAVDLDETLLFSSQIFPEIWQFNRGYKDPDIVAGFQYPKFAKTLKGRLAIWFGRPRYHCVNVSRYPFMASPRLIVAPNIPLLSALRWLQQKGAVIGLATASAKQRVDYLFERLPVLSSIFADRIMTAQDLAQRSIAAEQAEFRSVESGWTQSKSIHQARPLSLMTKTPWALSPMFDGEAYDLLIDDSNTTIELLAAHGLEDRTCQPNWPTHTRASVWDTVRDCLARAFPDALQKGQDIDYDKFPAPICTRIEDPYYWPLLHHDDQFSLAA